jgi:hypothetical protein
MSTFIFFWLFFCMLVGIFANQRRNRSGIGWFLLALLVSPLVAGLLVAVMRAKENEEIDDTKYARRARYTWLLGRPGGFWQKF